jgi:hypothetical protein
MGNAFYQEAAIFSPTGTIPVVILIVIQTIILMGFVYFANASVYVFDPKRRREVEIKLASRRRATAR